MALKPTTPSKTPEIEYVDRLDIVETYADSLGMIQLRKDGVRVEFCITRMDPHSSDKPAAKKRYPAARLVLTPEAAMDLLNSLNKMAKAVEQDRRTAQSDPTSKTLN